jgi:hypothetical protein
MNLAIATMRHAFFPLLHSVELHEDNVLTTHMGSSDKSPDRENSFTKNVAVCHDDAGIPG